MGMARPWIGRQYIIIFQKGHDVTFIDSDKVMLTLTPSSSFFTFFFFLEKCLFHSLPLPPPPSVNSTLAHGSTLCFGDKLILATAPSCFFFLAVPMPEISLGRRMRRRLPGMNYDARNLNSCLENRGRREWVQMF